MYAPMLPVELASESFKAQKVVRGKTDSIRL
jgi:hypothetical protein